MADEHVSMDFTETCWAFLSPSARDFVVKFDHFLREESELLDIVDGLSKREKLFISIYLKNRAIKRLIERERGKKTVELFEARQLRKVRGSSPRLHVCHGPGCTICGGGA